MNRSPKIKMTHISSQRSFFSWSVPVTHSTLPLNRFQVRKWQQKKMNNILRGKK